MQPAHNTVRLHKTPMTAVDTASLNRRLRLLEEAEYRRFFDDEDYDDENDEELAEELKRADIRLTLFHNVISRIQKFDKQRYVCWADNL